MRREEFALPILAVSCTIALSASLTSINRNLIREQPSYQIIFTSFFCIEAGIIYGLYMIISRMLSFFLSYIESSHASSSNSSSSYLASYHYDNLEEDEEECASSKNINIKRFGFNNGHREALISSMYLGGAGAFLALPALCFWDFSITASFLLSLTLIALLNDHTKHKEFTPNQDKCKVLLNIQLFRWVLYGLLLAIISGIAFQDSFYLMYAKANHTIAWPMMMLSFSSPLLIRMGTINPRTIAYNIIMSPSQSLEAGLPISTILAILILCWYSPLDTIFQKTSANSMQILVPMVVLCPSCLAAILAFIIRGFAKKQSLGVVIPLTCTCIIVQQVTDRKMKNHGDWGLVFGMAIALLVSLLFILYKRKVLAGELRSVHREPEVVLVQSEMQSLAAEIVQIEVDNGAEIFEYDAS